MLAGCTPNLLGLLRSHSWIYSRRRKLEGSLHALLPTGQLVALIASGSSDEPFRKSNHLDHYCTISFTGRKLRLH